MTGEFVKLALMLRHFFDRSAIKAESLTIILNFADKHEATMFDLALSEDLHPIIRLSGQGVDWALGRFEVAGIKFKIESPVHEEPD